MQINGLSPSFSGVRVFRTFPEAKKAATELKDVVFSRTIKNNNEIGPTRYYLATGEDAELVRMAQEQPANRATIMDIVCNRAKKFLK